MSSEGEGSDPREPGPLDGAQEPAAGPDPAARETRQSGGFWQRILENRWWNWLAFSLLYVAAISFLVWLTELDDATLAWLNDAGSLREAVAQIWQSSTEEQATNSANGLNTGASDFAVATTFLFFAVVLIASLYGIWIGASQKVLFRSFSHRIRGNRGHLVSNVMPRLPVEPDADVAACEPLRHDIRTLRESIRLGRDNVITRRLESIEAMLDGGSTLEGVSRHIQDLPGDPDGDRPRVALLNMVLMITLFAGIIGTFVGLMYFVVSDALQQVVQSDGSLDADQVQEILKAFQPAFGSSLVAYTSYIFVRFARDQADEAFQAAAGDLDAELQRPLKAHFRRYEIAARFQVKLEKEAAESLNRVVQQIADLQSTLETATNSLGSVSAGITEAAGALERTVTRMESQLGNFSTELQNASAEWNTTTQEFKTAAGDFNAAASNLLTQVRTSIGELDEMLKQASREAGKGAEELRKNVDAATGSLSQTMQQLEGVLTRFETAMQAERGREEAVQQTLDQVRKIAEQLREDIDQLPRMLQPVVERVDEQAKAHSDRVVETFGQLADRLSETNTGIRDYAAQLTGGEKGADLIRVLERIDNKLTDGAVPGSASGNGAADRA